MASPAPATEVALQRAIDCVWETIPPLWNQIRANVRSIASERYGISVQQFRILRHIWRGVGSVSELASVSQTSRPAISQCVGALVEKGLATRRRSTLDRRYVKLQVTESGGDMLHAIFEENRRWMMGKLASLGPEDVEHILQGLRALESAFTE
jgi:DNA-binding MarR family transcriptional regulator